MPVCAKGAGREDFSAFSYISVTERPANLTFR